MRKSPYVKNNFIDKIDKTIYTDSMAMA